MATFYHFLACFHASNAPPQRIAVASQGSDYMEESFIHLLLHTCLCSGGVASSSKERCGYVQVVLTQMMDMLSALIGCQCSSILLKIL